MKKVAFYTLGCKLNFSETSTISRSFEDKGFQKVAFNETPDVFIINTCSVTENADKKCRKIVREAQKINPEGYIAIIGCYAQLKPQEISEIEGVDAVLGAAEKFRLLDLIGDFKKEKSSILPATIYSTPIEEKLDYHVSYSINDRTRTFLKVQDGCDYPCAYCTIPLARGKSRSDSVENVVKTAKEIADTGVKEIVLTGVNIGDFGIIEGKRKSSFLELIQQLDEVKALNDFEFQALSQIYLPMILLNLLLNQNDLSLIFIFLCSRGSNKVLGLMKRRYKRELYEDRVNKIKELLPNCCIGVDVIVGHPGEGDEQFLETYNFLNELDCSYFHVFTYSERANTLAIAINESVSVQKRIERSKMLHILSEKKKRAFYENNINKSLKVLFEAEIEEGMMYGFSENYIKVKAKYDPLLVNTSKDVLLLQLDENGIGEIREIEEIWI